MSEKKILNKLDTTNLMTFMSRLNKCENDFIVEVLNDQNKIIEISGIVKPDDFRNKEMGIIYSIAVKAQFDNKDIFSELTKVGIKWSKYLEPERPLRNIKGLANEIIELKRKVQIAELLESSAPRVLDENIDEFIDGFQKEFIGVSRISDKEKSEIKDIVIDFNEEQKIHAEKIINGQGIIGMSCGFKKIDKIIDGLRKGHLWTIGGYTGSGKTFISLNILVELIEQGKRCIYFSLEMSKIDILCRLLGIMTGINGLKILKGLTTQEERDKIQVAKQQIIDSGLSIYSNTNELSAIRLSVSHEMMKKDVDIVMLDYLQLVKSGKQSEYETMKEVAIEFQSMAGKMNIPIILLSQISNEAAKNPNSRVIGYKGSGDIAAASDLALELMPAEQDVNEYRRKLNNGEPVDIKCIAKKNRHGAVGTVVMSFSGYNGIFTETTTEQEKVDEEFNEI